MQPKKISPRPETDWYGSGLDHIWLPYTQMKTAMPPLPVVKTLGSKIYLADGRELVDGVASWWTACHGYNHPHIIKNMQAQLEAMPHVMFGGLVHEPALTLAKRLAEFTGLPRVFFGDSGSVAVEIALKVALQYWKNTGKPEKNRFLCFTDGYHGDTAGAMSVSDPEKSMHKAFAENVIKQYVADIPKNKNDFAALESILAKHKDIAAVIIEPLVQGAGGMRFHSAEILAEIFRLTKKHGALFIADEIATGFWRTGNVFACDEANIKPDILCLGKALTGGAMTLAATLTQQFIFDAFLSDDPEAAFMHGPTYMANPLACAAANASLDIFLCPPLEGGRANVVSREGYGETFSTPHDSPSARPLPLKGGAINRISSQLRDGLEPCRKLKGVVDVRVKGAIGVVQMEPSFDVYALRPKFVERGVWIRPFKDIVYVTPAFTIKNEELDKLVQCIADTLY